MTVRSAALPGAMRRHLDTFRACVRSPADVWMVVRMSAWAVWLPALKYLLPLPKLVRLASAPPRRAVRRAEEERKIVTLARWLYAPMLRGDQGCLQRSLLAYRFLGKANARPRLLVGVRKEAGQILAHAWVSVDGEALGESPGWLGGFKAMLAFGPDGRPQPAE